MTGHPERLFVLGSFVAACCASVDHLPHPGESIIARSFTIEPGGKGFNVAAAASRLGSTVDCMTAVGEDVLGQMAEPAFKMMGLSTALLRRYPTSTGAGVGFFDANGENCIAVCPGANSCLCATDVRLAASQVSAAAMVVAGFEIADEPIEEAFAIARDAGRLTLLNPSPFRPPTRATIAATTIVVVNEHEAIAFARTRGVVPGDFAALADVLHQEGPDILLVTLGAAGAIAFPRGGSALVQSAFPVAAIDTIGAGDAFVAAFAAKLTNGHPLANALLYACAVGAIVASKVGTFAAFPSTAEVDMFLSLAAEADRV